MEEEKKPEDLIIAIMNNCIFTVTIFSLLAIVLNNIIFIFIGIFLCVILVGIFEIYSKLYDNW